MTTSLILLVRLFQGDQVLLHRGITERVVGAAIEVHRILGPGLLESVYHEALAYELGLRRVLYRKQVPLRLQYKGEMLASSFRIDFVVEEVVVVDLKCAEAILPIHEAQ